MAIEWEALNDIASRHFQHLGICDKRVDTNLGAQNGALSSVVSTHFRGVIKKATRDASLFRQTWTSREPGPPAAGVEGEMRARCCCGTKTVRRDGEQRPPRSQPAARSGAVRVHPESTLQAWVFGKILNWSVEHGVLSLQVKTDCDPERL